MNPDDVRREWADRTGEFSPTYYAYRGPNETSEAVRRRLAEYLDPDASILELGCGPGRHLAHLRDHGFENLHGVDINPESFEVMAEAYPDLAESGTFVTAAIEDVVETFETGQFDAVYTVQTLQHVHPDDEWVFAEVARCAGDVLVTVENEGDPAARGEGVNDSEYDFPLYYRDWERVFTASGLEQVAAESRGRDTLRAFRRRDE